MCPCEPISEADIIVPPLPPGFGGLTVPQLEPFDLSLFALPIEDLLDLFNKLNMLLPTGILKPHLSADFSKGIFEAILSLLQQFMPFLMAYSLLMPILNMILCIIEILCAINNPVKLVKGLVRLFRVCIPSFLSIFPWFAIILMILALLLLILALIAYLIQRIIALIKQIIANIMMLANAIASADNDSVIAITIKLGDLLCIFQNLFVLLGVIFLIFNLIEKLLNLSFKLPPCDDADSSDDGCCTPDVCPSFIKNQKEISSSKGSLQYFNNVIQTGGILGPVILRQSSFQLYDASAPVPLAFNNITHAYDLPAGVSNVFFPEGETYTANTTPNSVPYTVEVRFFYDPALFGRTDVLGARFIRVKNCIVLKQPIDGVIDYQGHIIAPFNGTLTIAGGLAWEDDGIKAVKLAPTDDASATLNTIIALPDTTTTSPILTPAGGILFDQITYTLTTNHIVLISKSLITIGCHPDVASNKNAMNDTLGKQLNTVGEALKGLKIPDVQGAQDCVLNAVAAFKKSVSVETAAQLQTTVVNCLTDLQNQTNKAIEDVVNIGADPYKSTFALDVAIQFTTKPIQVSVALNESGGNSITNNLPGEVAAKLAANITADITLGDIGKFTYDGSSQFVAPLTSKISGNGKVKISYNGNSISVLDNPTDTTQPITVSITELLYTFVQSPSIAVGAGSEAGEVRRDESDVAGEARS